MVKNRNNKLAKKGKTPGEACGIRIEEKNKWLSLIQNASMGKS
jgi:hypothetical protein